MPDVDHYDFFVSYARSDNANGWISNFVEELLAEHQKFAAGRELPYFMINKKSVLEQTGNIRSTTALPIQSSLSPLFLPIISPANGAAKSGVPGSMRRLPSTF